MNKEGININLLAEKQTSISGQKPRSRNLDPLSPSQEIWKQMFHSVMKTAAVSWSFRVEADAANFYR